MIMVNVKNYVFDLFFSELGQINGGECGWPILTNFKYFLGKEFDVCDVSLW